MRVGSVAFLAGLATSYAAVTGVTRSGRYLVVNGTQSRFNIKGLAYQPAGSVAASTAANEANGGFPEPDSYIDPLANLANCQRDLPNFVQLGINTIRVYSVNPALDHSGCMNLFNDNGIYVIADLALPLNGSINRASPSWDVSLLNEYILTLDNLAKYSNLLAVNVGNEIITGTNNSQSAPFIKAAARDIKAYIKSKGYSVLVSYASVDGDDWQTSLAQYLNCGSADISLDLYGFNNYRWCGDSSYSAAYAGILGDFQNLVNIPVYFSEFGCITAGTRTWQEVAAIYSSPANQVLSGAVAFEYFADQQGFGMTANLTNPNATSVTTNEDFANLVTAYGNVANTTTLSSSSTAAYPTCQSNVTATLLATSALPPTPNAQACACFVQNAFACTVKPNTLPAVLGSLLDYTCNAIGAAGGNCDAISANGTTGTYGEFSYCTPEQKLDAAFSAYYQSQNSNAAACDFSGNATLNTAISSSNAASAVSQCESGTQATFTPSAVAALVSATGNKNAAAVPTDTTTSKSGASALTGSFTAAAGLLLAAGLAVYA